MAYFLVGLDDSSAAVISEPTRESGSAPTRPESSSTPQNQLPIATDALRANPARPTPPVRRTCRGTPSTPTGLSEMVLRNSLERVFRCWLMAWLPQGTTPLGRIVLQELHEQVEIARSDEREISVLPVELHCSLEVLLRGTQPLERPSLLHLGWRLLDPPRLLPELRLLLLRQPHRR